jgi:hypothetical protein
MKNLKKILVFLTVCVIAVLSLPFSALAIDPHYNYTLDKSIKITATVDGKILPENGNVPLLSEINFQIATNSVLDWGWNFAYHNEIPIECGGINLNSSIGPDNTMTLIMREGYVSIDGKEISVTYGKRSLRVETRDGKYNEFVWNVVEMDTTKRYVPDGFEIVRIETAGKELSTDKNNPTSFYAQNSGFICFANMALPKEVRIPDYLARWCYQADEKWNYEKMGLTFSTVGICSPGWSYNDIWTYAGKVTGFKLQILDYNNSIITESPTYYVKWELREAQQYGVKGLVKRIVLTANSLEIEPRDGYWMGGGSEYIVNLTDKTTGISSDYELEFYNLNEETNLAKNARITGLSLNPAHVYGIIIKENTIFTRLDPTQVNVYKYNAEWVSELVVEGSRRFDDIEKDHWANEYIKEAIGKHIIEGYRDGQFRPQGTVTRNEFAKMMLKTLQLPVKTGSKQTFADIDNNNWAYDYVESVKEYLTGYKNGETYYFKGNDPAVREDMAVALVKAMGLENEAADENELKTIFSDWEEISPNLRKFVLIAYQNKLIDGYPGGWFGPQQSITRAETVALLSKVYQSDAMEKVVFD